LSSFYGRFLSVNPGIFFFILIKRILFEFFLRLFRVSKFSFFFIQLADNYYNCRKHLTTNKATANKCTKPIQNYNNLIKTQTTHTHTHEKKKQLNVPTIFAK